MSLIRTPFFFQDTLGSGCPRGGTHSSTAGSPAATTTSPGGCRKSSRSTAGTQRAQLPSPAPGPSAACNLSSLILLSNGFTFKCFRIFSFVLIGFHVFPIIFTSFNFFYHIFIYFHSFSVTFTYFHLFPIIFNLFIISLY